MNLLKKIFNRTIIKLSNFISYLIANTVLRKKIDNENNCFNMYSDEELITEIVKNKKSFSRFGDGELSIILDKKFNINFQSNSIELREKLSDVLSSNLDNLIIGISVGFNNPAEYSKKIQKYFRAFNLRKRNKFKRIISLDKKYGNASITRFYMDYEHDDIEGANRRLNNLKRIWNNRNILIVEGEFTKLGVGNDLFNNAKSIRRILIPATNAYNKLRDIEKSILERHKKDELVLIAAGPTATILSYDLTLKGIQAIDIGHIDIEYEWMKMKAKKRVQIRGKYVNEAKGKKIDEYNSTDEDYNNSIICKI